jgi:Tol biopolymer transport system component
VILPPRPTKIIAAAWLPERRGLLMTAVDPESGLPQIWRVGYPDGTERRLTDDLHNYKDLTITADGSRVVTQSLGHLVQLWMAPGTDAAHAKQIASGTARGAYDDLVWTADHRLLYRWGERGVYDIWSMAPDGHARRQLTANARDVSNTSSAPDGRFIFFVSTRSGSSQIWRMTQDGEDVRQLTHMKSTVLRPVASADGRRVYFTADERGIPTLWNMTVDGESIAEVSDERIELFDLSPDGKWLAYSHRDEHQKRVRVAVVALDQHVPAKRFDIEPTFALKWTPDGQGLAFTHEQGNIWIQPLSGAAPYAVTQQHPGFKVVTFAWSSDARYLAYTVVASPMDAIAFNLR